MRQLKLIIAALLLISSMAAHAAPILEGLDPVEHGSFTVSTDYSGWDAFATIEVFLVSESGQGPFQAPGFETEGIDGELINPFYSLWSGASDGSGELNFFLDGDATGTMLIDVLVFAADGTFMTLSAPDKYEGFSAQLTVSNGLIGSVVFFGVDHDLDQYDRTAVSEPGTLALLGLGLVGMAARRKKKV